VTAIVLSACGSTPATPLQRAQTAANAAAVAAGCPTKTSTRVNTLTWTTAPKMSINVHRTYEATFDTTAGTFVVKLDAAQAPITVNNFVFLADHDFYNCVIFHRAIPGFMIQGGDPTGTGEGGPGYTIADENPPVGNPTYPDFSIAMANTGAPHSGGSQFFIVTGPDGEGLPNTYALFGRVVSGQGVVMTIQGYGNPSQTANGVPPLVIERMLKVTISSTPS
jgi:cyclophilin family peptidyl-prolyl cis-trans isomerase